MSAISSMHSMVISVESMSVTNSRKSSGGGRRDEGAVELMASQ
jgi:hypothetical protein